MSGVALSSNERDYAERVVSRFAAAILSVNDTLLDPLERERMRRAVLDASELLTRRIWDWHVDASKPCISGCQCKGGGVSCPTA